MTAQRIGLTVGPILFHWPAETIRDFYARIADEAPVDHVVVGEVVCSKRLPHYADILPAAVERLHRGGKRVSLTSLALPTLGRECLAARALFEADLSVELNDLSAMPAAEGHRFSIGPLINVYNEATLDFLAAKGAESVCLPPELPLNSVHLLAEAGHARGIGIELWAYGRAPLAISARCYHARVHGTSKNSCLFVCGEDADGLSLRTLDGRNFLAINGVQTLSHNFVNLIGDTQAISAASMTALRLSPHTGDFVAVTKAFRSVLDGSLDPAEAQARMHTPDPEADFSHGFLMGTHGAEPLAAI